MLSHNPPSTPHKYDWEMLKSDWFFRLLIKFLKKNLLYERVAELYLSPIKEGIVTCLSEAYSTNYLPEKMFFGTLSCTLTEALQDGLFDDYNFEEYEKKWSQFMWTNRNVIPEEIRAAINLYYGEDFKGWFLSHYEYRFEQDLFWEQANAIEDKYDE